MRNCSEHALAFQNAPPCQFRTEQNPCALCDVARLLHRQIAVTERICARCTAISDFASRLKCIRTHALIARILLQRKRFHGACMTFLPVSDDSSSGKSRSSVMRPVFMPRWQRSNCVAPNFVERKRKSVTCRCPNVRHFGSASSEGRVSRVPRVLIVIKGLSWLPVSQPLDLYSVSCQIWVMDLALVKLLQCPRLGVPILWQRLTEPVRGCRNNRLSLVDDPLWAIRLLKGVNDMYHA